MSYVHANIYFLIESLFTQNTATISHISLKISKTSVVDMSCLSKCHIPAFNVLLLQATAIGGSGPPGPRTPNRIMGILGWLLKVWNMLDLFEGSVVSFQICLILTIYNGCWLQVIVRSVRVVRCWAYTRNLLKLTSSTSDIFGMVACLRLMDPQGRLKIHLWVEDMPWFSPTSISL